MKRKQERKETAERVVDQTVAQQEMECPVLADEECLAQMIEAKLPGVMNGGEQKEDQQDEVVEKTFETIARFLEELPIESIEHFGDFPDFATPTDAEHPIIIRTPAGIFCIDGWDLIEAANAEGKINILCEVDALSEHSFEELCLRKGAIRSATRGGKSTYAEMVRNTQILKAVLEASDEDLRVFGHGGPRYGAGFVNNREEDLRHVLAMRLGRDRDTLNAYLNHAEYLDEATLDAFIKEGASKKFFEMVQAQKRRELKVLKEKKIFSYGRITEAISALMMEAFLAFKQRDEGARNSRPSGAEPNPGENFPDVTTPVDSDENEDEYPAAGYDSEDPIIDEPPEEPLTIDAVKHRALELAQRIATDLSRDITLDDVERRLQAEIQAMTNLLATITALKNAGTGQ